MPTYQYRLNIRDPDNGNSHNVGMTDPLKQMRPFTVAGNGGCLEAQFSALTTGMDIKPRSIVTLETKTDAADWVPRYKGVAVVPGATRSFYPTSVKLAPMKKRFYEKIIPSLKITGGDVGAMVRSVVSVVGNRPAGTVYNAAEIPDLSLTLGDRYTFGLESVGDFMDAMAAACPADGASPAVTWDVYPDGTIFFKRVNTSRTYTIGTNGVKVKWKEIDAEDVCSKVTLLFASELYPSGVKGINDSWNAGAPEPLEYIPVPLTYPYDAGGNLDAAKVIPVQLSQGLLAKQSLTASTVYSTGSIIDLSDSVDSDVTSFAEIVDYFSLLVLNQVSGHVVWVDITYESDVDPSMLFLRIAYTSSTSSAVACYLDLPLPKSEQTGKPITMTVIGLVSSQLLGVFDQTGISVVWRNTVAGTFLAKVYDISAYKLNEPLAERIAKSHIRIPAQEAAEVIVPGIETPVTRVTLTGYGTYNVAAVEYGPGKDSADGGMQTIFRLEQADDPELTGQSSLIKQADSKATMQAIQFQRRG